MRRALKQAAEAIRQASKVILASHVNPDGDALGSMLALAHALKGMGKCAVPVSSDGVPDIYRWMPGQDWVVQETLDRDFDLAIVCDTGTVARIGTAKGPVDSAQVSLNIDHHAAEGSFGDIRVVDPRAAATGELTHALLRELRVPLNKQIADCLMCAIVTDTGSFRFMNVTPNTLRIAGLLMRCGASPAEIGELVFECRSLASMKLLGRALDSLQLAACGKVAWAQVRAQDFAELSATDEDTEGIVTHVRSVRGAQIGILFREIPGRKVRISLRGRNGVDVNRIAAVFGGGGHRLAAGCSVDPPLEEAEALVLAEAVRSVTESLPKGSQ